MKIDFDSSRMSFARDVVAKNEKPAPAKLTPQEERLALEAQKAAQEFEAMFAEVMLKSMRQTAMPEDSSNAMDIFQGMLDTEYAKAMTSNGDLGVKNMVLDWMKQADPKLAVRQYQLQAAVPMTPMMPALGGTRD
jgi:Rod binding domain-containing protein